MRNKKSLAKKQAAKLQQAVEQVMAATSNPSGLPSKQRLKQAAKKARTPEEPGGGVQTADSVWASIVEKNRNKNAPPKETADRVWSRIVKAQQATKPAAVAAADRTRGAAPQGQQSELPANYRSTVDSLIAGQRKGPQAGGAPPQLISGALAAQQQAEALGAPEPQAPPKRPLVTPEQAAAARAQRMAKRRKQSQSQNQQAAPAPKAEEGKASTTAAPAERSGEPAAAEARDSAASVKEGESGSDGGTAAPKPPADGPAAAKPARELDGSPKASGNHENEDNKKEDGAAAAAAAVEDQAGQTGSTENPEDAPELLNPKLTKRMVKNRESAARSRAKKQAMTDELKAQVAALKKENEELKAELARYKAKEQDAGA